MVIGFQSKPMKDCGSGFGPNCIRCMIPRNWPVSSLDIHKQTMLNNVLRELYLGLQFTTEAIHGNQRVLGGFSRGPVINLQRGAPRVIAFEKPIQPADAEVFEIEPQHPSKLPGWLVRLFNAPYVLCMPIHWLKALFEKLVKVKLLRNGSLATGPLASGRLLQTLEVYTACISSVVFRLSWEAKRQVARKLPHSVKVQ